MLTGSYLRQAAIMAWGLTVAPEVMMATRSWDCVSILARVEGWKNLQSRGFRGSN